MAVSQNLPYRLTCGTAISKYGVMALPFILKKLVVEESQKSAIDIRHGAVMAAI